MRRTLVLTLIGLFLSISGFSQLTLPLINNFQKITVSQQSLFQGKVIFDQGLDLTGDARFMNTIYGLGDLSISRAVSFPGLNSVEAYRYIITSDETGKLTRIPFSILASQLENGGLSALKNLTVTKVTTLNGDLILGEGLNINGAALFKNSLTALGNLDVAGAVKLTGIDQVNASAQYSVLGMDANGTVVNIPLPNIGMLPNLPGSNPCLLGGMRAMWSYDLNKITTDICSSDIKVGIGTQQPTEALQVNGFALITGSAGFNSIGERGVLYLGDKLNSISAKYGSGLALNVPNKSEALVINNNGMVGIGKETPTAVLHVSSPAGISPFVVENDGKPALKVYNGITYASEINVRLASEFPDYVFSTEYKLMSLEELRSYIAKNKHLPNMPTAANVAGNGLDLGEATRILTEKVEELTLYVLQLEEKIKKLENK